MKNEDLAPYTFLNTLPFPDKSQAETGLFLVFSFVPGEQKGGAGDFLTLALSLESARESVWDDLPNKGPTAQYQIVDHKTLVLVERGLIGEVH